MMDVVAIVPFRGDAAGFRRRNLEIVLRWLDAASVRSLLVEHSDEPSDLAVPTTTTRIHVAAEGRAFNKARACNTGFRQVSESVIALVDADTLMSMTPFLTCVNAVRDDLDVIRPYGRLIELDEAATMAIAAGSPLPDAEPGTRDDARAGEHIPLCGGLAILKASAYASVGGMDEAFEGWGGEDDALSIALMRSGKRCAILESDPAFHLAHPRTMDSRYGHPHYQRNLDRARWWHEAADEDLAAEMQAIGERQLRQG